MAASETAYAVTADGVHIAYQVRGEAPSDLVFLEGFTTNFEIDLEEPRFARLIEALASRWRVILFDKRGTGLSDRDNTPDMEKRADDLRAVLDAVGSEAAILAGQSEGAALAMFFAATYPQRVVALVSFDGWARVAWAPDYPGGMTHEAYLADTENIATRWGTVEMARDWARGELPDFADDESYVRWMAKTMRHSASPAAALRFQEIWYATDVRGILGSIQTPTLLVTTEGYHGYVDEIDSSAVRQYLVEHIPGAQSRSLPGTTIAPYGQDPRLVVEVISSFLDSIHSEQRDFERVLATVLFTDIIGSTDRAAEMGDRDWGGLLDRHHQVVRAMLGRYRGAEVSTAGDGFFATFDGPARAVRCAQAIVSAVRPLGIEIRAGVHTGEIEYMGDNVGGMGVHIGARVGSTAGPSEVIVSSTVHDLVVGSGLTFHDHGVHELKGVPGEWRLYKASED
jgi:pimeloyl-ACP methyl ester carboxylesterase